MIGQTIIELDRVDSTNTYASQLISKEPVEEGLVIRADEQFAGRGQQDHIWASEAGKNLTFSVILKPWFLAPDRQFLLNKVVSLAVVDFISDMLENDPGSRIQHFASRIQITPHPRPLPNKGGELRAPDRYRVSIKWPNDIYVGDLKIGGILIENRIMGSRLETCIAGIGININQNEFHPDIPNPVSLMQICHTETNLKVALHSVCNFLDLRYTSLRQFDLSALDLEYDQHLLGYQQWRIFQCGEGQTEGKIKGVDTLGRLLIETRTGEIQRFSHGEIVYYINGEMPK